jgi:hypothetical protein
MRKRFQIFLHLAMGICLLLCCSGCYVTQTVANVGVRTEILQVHQAMIAGDGAVALDCMASYRKPRIGYNAGYEEKIHVRKFLVASPQVFDWTVTNAVSADESNHGPLATNLVRIGHLAYASTNPFSWTIITKRHAGRDATLQDLPKEFNEAVFIYPGGKIPYDVGGKSFYVLLPTFYDNPQREFRRWWGYPTLILVPPAIAVDIVASPYEFYLAMKALGEALN